MEDAGILKGEDRGVVLALSALGADRVKLATARVLKGLTQAQLAQQAGVSPVTIIHLEKGRVRRPQPATVYNLARALDLDARTIDEFRSVLGLE